MITRPLDLASRLRKPPRTFDSLFLVNGALIGLFFALFGSRFVLAPGLWIDDGQSREVVLPRTDNAIEGAARAAIVISVTGPGIVVTDEGRFSYPELRQWLLRRGQRDPGARLLVRADVSLPMQDFAEISAMARAAGLTVQLAAEPAASAR
ncbi:MAG TPA: biopolymer transporter ExbD [Opitutaceae bacterium]